MPATPICMEWCAPPAAQPSLAHATVCESLSTAIWPGVSRKNSTASTRVSPAPP